MTAPAVRDGGRRTAVVLASLAGALMIAAAVVAVGGGVGPEAAVPPPVREDTTDVAPTTVASTAVPSTAPSSSLRPESIEKGPAYVTQPDRRYITIGTLGGRQFTDAELVDLATNYGVVVFTKFHGGWDVRLHHEATRRLKAINPDVEVYAYMSTKYWFDANSWDGAVIDDDWLLRDERGNVIAVTKETYNPESKELGSYIDLTDPDYHAWVLDVARSWVAAAPYDGIRFDAADPIGDHGDRDVKKWAALLPPDRIAAYNEGIESLLRTFVAALAPRRILFNGISPAPIRGPDRDLFMLDFTHGAMDEEFCVTASGELHDIAADIDIMSRHPEESLQLRASLPTEADPQDQARLQRVCVASFFLGWQPGNTHFSIGTTYGVEQLAQQPRDLDLNLGAPLGPMERTGDLLHREFAHGDVYLNLGASAVAFDPPAGVVRMENGAPHPVADSDYTLGAEDGALFLHQSFLIGS